MKLVFSDQDKDNLTEALLYKMERMQHTFINCGCRVVNMVMHLGDHGVIRFRMHTISAGRGELMLAHIRLTRLGFKLVTYDALVGPGTDLWEIIYKLLPEALQ